jgi:hypothetical protein
MPSCSTNLRRLPALAPTAARNTHFVRPLRGRVRNHAVDTNRCKQQRKGGKGREQRADDAVRQHGSIYDLFERADIAQRLVLVDPVNGRPNGSLQRLRRYAGSDD